MKRLIGGGGGGSGTPGGSDTEIQYNDSGAFAGSADLTWDDTGKVLDVGGDVVLDDGGTYTTTLQTITATANRTISLPDSTGTVALVAGSSGQFIFNNAGALGGSTVLSIDGSNNIIQNAGRYLLGVTSANANGGALQLSGGITFPATQVAASDPNTLDDYEEGTWTPVISDGTNNATMDGQTTARYTKIGNQVTIHAFVITSALGSATGSVRITGLPFAASSVTYSGVTACYGQGLNIAAGQSVAVRPIQNNSYAQVYLWDSADGTSNIQFTEWSADGGIIFSTSYLV